MISNLIIAWAGGRIINNHSGRWDKFAHKQPTHPPLSLEIAHDLMPFADGWAVLKLIPLFASVRQLVGHGKPEQIGVRLGAEAGSLVLAKPR